MNKLINTEFKHSVLWIRIRIGYRFKWSMMSKSPGSSAKKAKEGK
jgi:hypothetical protein